MLSNTLLEGLHSVVTRLAQKSVRASAEGEWKCLGARERRDPISGWPQWSGETHKASRTLACGWGLDRRPIYKEALQRQLGGCLGGRPLPWLHLFPLWTSFVSWEQPTSCLSGPLAASLVPGTERHPQMFSTFYYFPKWEYIFMVTVYWIVTADEEETRPAEAARMCGWQGWEQYLPSA